MARKKSKYVGSCGIYVIVDKGDGRRLLLVHRRSKQVSEKGTLCTPGGIVERSVCGADGDDFEAGARTTALRELTEESGVRLPPAAVDSLLSLPVGKGAYWGAEWHRNFCAVISDFPLATGPEKDSMHEVDRNGVADLGIDAGDGYHAWLDVEELLERADLMEGCRVPLEYVRDEVACRTPEEAAEAEQRELESVEDDGALDRDRSRSPRRHAAAAKGGSRATLRPGPQQQQQQAPRGMRGSAMRMLQATAKAPPPSHWRNGQGWPCAGGGVAEVPWWELPAGSTGAGSAGGAWSSGWPQSGWSPAVPSAAPQYRAGGSGSAVPTGRGRGGISAKSSLRPAFPPEAEDILELSASFDLPRVAVFDLDDTCWKHGLDRKPFKGPPFTWSDAHGTLVDSGGAPVRFLADLGAVLLSLHRAGVQLAVASHNAHADWCGEVMDKFVLDESEGLCWGDIVPSELRIIEWEGKYWPQKTEHLRDIQTALADSPDGPPDFDDMIFFDDGKKVCREVEDQLGMVAVRCPDGISMAKLKEALERLGQKRNQC
eukprot:TRINITY_DN1422_c2_g1_i2.p2 TRINITY_DN1422_c2_g1~~TRINITY_DN1422_c2_g1_i2.p2  ORF type:complete len:543 (+),score=125.80 TRINITY_DN1422_c2_g1_i2:145-1773(+)